MNVGVVGLGAMGMGVARQLLAKSFQVHGCDLRDDARKALVAAGGSAHESPAELGAVCEALIVFVVSARQATDALFGQQGAAQTLRRGAVVISCVTASPADNKALADRLDTAGIQMIGAPVSGGIKGAADGQLTLMASGPDSAFEACTELLQAISSKVYRLDTEHGMASKVKIINQLLVGVHIAATAEAMALGLREGVDPDLLYDVIKNSAGNSWAFTDRAPRILKSEFVASAYGARHLRQRSRACARRRPREPLPAAVGVGGLPDVRQCVGRWIGRRRRHCGDQDIPRHQAAESKQFSLTATRDPAWAMTRLLFAEVTF